MASNRSSALQAALLLLAICSGPVSASTAVDGESTGPVAGRVDAGRAGRVYNAFHYGAAGEPRTVSAS
jgi:hypothetical protein